jgi:hypothetical protein
VKLSDHFVLGWAGNLKTANTVFREIRKQIRGQALTLDRVEEILSACPKATGIRVLQLLGWVVDESGPVCFSWDSNNVSMIRQHENMQCIGTGASEFDEIYHGLKAYNPQLDMTNVKYIPENWPALYVLAIAGKLMERETLAYRQFKNLSDANTTFGHAYEFLYYDGERFKYIDDVMYVFMQKAIIPENDSYKGSHLILMTPFFRVVSRRRLTAVVRMGSFPAQLSIARPPGETKRSAKSLEKYIGDLERKINSTSPFARFCVAQTDYYTLSDSKYLTTTITVQSEDSPPEERAITFKRVGDDFQLTQTDIRQFVDKSLAEKLKRE